MSQPRWESRWAATRQKGESKKPLIYRAKDGSYWLELRAFTYGKSADQGDKAKTYRRKGFASEAYAGAAIADLIEDVLRGKQPPALPAEPESITTLSDWLDVWHEDRLRGAWTKGGKPLRPNTAVHEKRHIKVIQAVLGSRDIKTLTEDDVIAFLRSLRRDDPLATVTGQKAGKASSWPVSYVGKTRSQAQIWGVLHRALRAARKDRLISADPSLGVDGPTSRKTTPAPFRRDELEAILSAADRPLPYESIIDEDFSALVHLLWHTGARIGEALALWWEDIDLEAGVVSIEHTLSEVNGVGLVRGEPKTASSKRTIHISQMMVDRLKRLRATRGAIPLPNQFIFISERGGALRKSNLLRRRWHPMLTSVGIKTGGFHRIRHSHATFLLKQTDHVTVQKRLGHSNAATTLAVYGGSIEGQDEAAARAIERITLDHASNASTGSPPRLGSSRVAIQSTESTRS